MQLGVTSTSTMPISFYLFFLFSSSVSLSSCLVLLSLSFCLVLLSLSFCLFFCFSLFLFSSSVSLSFCLVLRYLSLSVCSSVSLNLIHSLLLSIYFSLSVFRQIFIFFLLLSLSNKQLHTCFIFSIIGTVSLSLRLYFVQLFLSQSRFIFFKFAINDFAKNKMGRNKLVHLS